jgi:hypothetical protein
MPAGKSPITVLAEALSAMPTLSGFAKVLAGKNALALSRSPPSIVIFPVEGGYDSPHDNIASLIDVDMKVAAHLWAADLDACWDLRQRYIQALKAQAIGNPTAPILATPDQGGVYYEFLTEAWDIEPDTQEQGQEMEVVIAARFAASPTIQLGLGEIDATALHGLRASLTSPLAATGVTAAVDSTAGFASSGSLSIDSEQLSYTGITVTSFTGLTRGVNGTTPAAHASTATVTQ